MLLGFWNDHTGVPRGFLAKLKNFDPELDCIYDPYYRVVDHVTWVEKIPRFRIVRDVTWAAVPMKLSELTVMEENGFPGGEFRYPNNKDIEKLERMDTRKTLGVKTGDYNPDVSREAHYRDVQREFRWKQDELRKYRNEQQNYDDYARKNMLRDWNNPHSV